MAEKRFHLTEPGQTCSDIQKEDLQCFDECIEASYELGFGFKGDQRNHSTKTQPNFKSCYIVGFMPLYAVVGWRQYGAKDMNNWTQAICRKNSKSILQ